MMYDLNLMRIFAALIDEGSVTRAAHRLGMTQPAVSGALTRLRALIGDPLFVRERYGMRPTEKALALAPAITRALAGIDDAVMAAQGFDPATARRSFVISANSYAEFVLLPALVARVQAEAPGVRLRVLPFGADLAETGLLTGDTALALGRIVDPPDTLVVQEILTDGLSCVLRADHPDAAGGRLDRAAFERLRHVNLLPPGRLKVGLFQVLERLELQREVAVSVTHFLAIPELVAATDLCATLPTAICRRLAGDARLKVLEPPADFGRFPGHMAWHLRHREDDGHRWLRRLVREIAAAAVGP